MVQDMSRSLLSTKISEAGPVAPRTKEARPKSRLDSAAPGRHRCLGMRLPAVALILSLAAAMPSACADSLTDTNSDGSINLDDLSEGELALVSFMCALAAWPDGALAVGFCAVGLISSRVSAATPLPHRVAIPRLPSGRSESRGKAILAYQLRSQKYAADGKVTAAKASPVVLSLPIAFLEHPQLKRVFIEVFISLVDKKFETPRKQFKSVEVRLEVDGRTIGKNSTDFDPANATASVAFEGLKKLKSTDIVVATVTFSGGSVTNSDILVRGTAAGE